MSRLTGREKRQRIKASYRAKDKRDSAEIERLLTDIAYEVKELRKINCAPLKLPTGHSSSVIEVDRPRSVEPETDYRINNYFDSLRIDLMVKRDQARALRKERK